MKMKKSWPVMLSLSLALVGCGGGGASLTEGPILSGAPAAEPVSAPGSVEAIRSVGTFKPSHGCAEVNEYVSRYVEISNLHPDQVVPVEGPEYAGEDSSSSAMTSKGLVSASATGQGITQSEIAHADVDGGLLYTLNYGYGVPTGGLKIFQTDPAQGPAEISSLPLDFNPREILSVDVSGKRILVLFGWLLEEQDGYYDYKTVVSLVDVTDPSQPEEFRREIVPGYFVEGKSLDDRGAVTWVTYRPIPTYLESLDVKEVLPEKTLIDGAGVEVKAPSVACENVLLYENESLSEGYSPYTVGTTFVSLLNLGGESFETKTQAILSPSWKTIVSSNADDHLILAQNIDDPAIHSTEIYRFDLNAAEQKVTLGASGAVAGDIVNRFFIDEKDDTIRVFHRRFLGEVGNYVSTLRADGSGKLGVVGSFGPFESAEEQYTARFMGNIGCVITFLVIDPLTCFDLRDPAQPRRLGELQIEGVSLHLEQVSEDLLLGIGVDGGLSGVVANLFDISDPSQPLLADQITLSDPADYFSYSEVFYDFRALGKDGNSARYVVPMEWYNDSVSFGWGSSLSLFSVDAGAKRLELEKVLRNEGATNYWEDNYLRGFFFDETLAALSRGELTLFLLQDYTPVFNSPL